MKEGMHYHEIRLRRTVHAPLREVWTAWADAERMSGWFTDSMQHDFRVGGRYSNSDGDCGEYLEIVECERLSFTWEQPDYKPGGVVTLHFRSTGDDLSELLLEHTRVDCDDEGDLTIAWNWALDSLVTLLERGEQLEYDDWARRQGL